MRGMLPDGPRLCSVDPDMVPEAEKGQSAPTPGGTPHSWRAQPHPLWAACWIRRLCMRKLGEWLSPLTPRPGPSMTPMMPLEAKGAKTPGRSCFNCRIRNLS